ncbi:hypothetical protein BGZ98_002897 [Dissophora globulifera]|nr:hypothetical protein BGZ98_002897 [Dissophora globulifera]
MPDDADSTAVQLPNECLCLILEHLQDDLSTLHALLFVNRFFFRAAVALIWTDPLSRLRDSTRKPSREKLIVVLLASLLYHHQTPSRSASDILNEFGLRLKSDLSAYPLLRDAVRDRSSSHSSTFDDPNYPGMTMDYSRLFTILRPDDWPVIFYRQFVSLQQTPASVKEYSTEGSPTASASCADGDDDNLYWVQDYREEIEQRICAMVLRFHSNLVREVLFDIRKAKDTFLPLANRMASLRSMYIVRPTVLPDEQLQATVAFIRQNQSAFPAKPRLRLELESGWTDYDIDPYAPPLPSETEKARQIRVRDALWYFARPKLLLYEAVGLPSAMQVYRIPGFYTRVSQYQIGLERLTEFADADQDRLDDIGGNEAVAMRSFFERCTNLEELALAVGNPQVFSWAARHRRQRYDGSGPPSLSMQTILGKLRKLSLHSIRSFHYLICAMNDAFVAFSDTLTSIHATGYQQINAITLSSPSWMEFRNDPKANRFGDFAFLLPCLTCIDINLKSFPGFQLVGSFSQCPALRTLRIESGKVVYEPQRRQERPVPMFNPDRELEFTLFPKWDMPQLQSLTLQGTAALRFDYESLESMVRLERLVLRSDLWTSMHRYFWRIPRLSAHLAVSDTLYANDEDLTDILRCYGFGNDRDSDGDYKNISDTLENPKWNNTWTLPCLKTLVLQGPQICVFDFSWLTGSPLLTTLLLTLEGAPRRLPFSNLSHTFSANSGDVSSDGRLSHLTQLSIIQWIVSWGDFTRLLAMVSGSPLQGLIVENLHEKSTLTGAQLVRAVHDLDTQHTQEAQERQEIRMTKSLRYITSDLSLTNEESDLAGLTQIPGSEAWGLYYHKRGKRIYSMGTGYFVRHTDVVSDPWVEERE